MEDLFTEQAVQMTDPADGPFFGGNPTTSLDIPISAVFLVLFALTGAAHIAIYVKNMKRRHKFLVSILLFDFCLDRVLTCALRIAWAMKAQRGVILVELISDNATTVIFAANVIFTQRIIRAMHPRVGWHPAFTTGTRFLIVAAVGFGLLNVICLLVGFFSVGDVQRQQDLQEAIKVGHAFFLAINVTPLVMLFVAAAVPGPEIDNFGTGQLRSKAMLPVLGLTFFSIGTAVRLGAESDHRTAIAANQGATKAALYTTEFMLELITIVAYAAFRVDLLFHIPNGSKKPGDYSSTSLYERYRQEQKNGSANHSFESSTRSTITGSN